MQNPFERTLIQLAVASACGFLPISGHAQETQAGTPASPDATAGDAATAKAAATPPAVESAPVATPEPPSAANTVVVSGSRIAARGFTQPTPTTTLTAADFEKAAKPNMFESLVELPALQAR
jgi:hypothetical protein